MLTLRFAQSQMLGCGLDSSTSEIGGCWGHLMIASVTVSATTICSKLIVKTSYKSDVIYQKWFGTEDGKPLEYNRNPAKKCVPYPHLWTLLSTLHMNALEGLTLPSWGWEQSEATIPETQGRKCLPQKDSTVSTADTSLPERGGGSGVTGWLIPDGTPS